LEEKVSDNKGVLTTEEMSYIVIVVPGLLVMEESYARFTYVISDPLTDLSRGWCS
jgi:hypothetical protein